MVDLQEQATRIFGQFRTGLTEKVVHLAIIQATRALLWQKDLAEYEYV